jgi:hypothetical protein
MMNRQAEPKPPVSPTVQKLAAKASLLAAKVLPLTPHENSSAAGSAVPAQNAAASRRLPLAHDEKAFAEFQDSMQDPERWDGLS